MKNIILYFITKYHKWHKDWFGCWMCEFKMRNQKFFVVDEKYKK